MHHLLEIDSIIKNFGTRQLLTDVYLKINTGDVIGLFGRNGTGKSVLMQIIFGKQTGNLSGWMNVRSFRLLTNMQGQ